MRDAGILRADSVVTPQPRNGLIQSGSRHYLYGGLVHYSPVQLHGVQLGGQVRDSRGGGAPDGSADRPETVNVHDAQGLQVGSRNIQVNIWLSLTGRRQPSARERRRGRPATSDAESRGARRPEEVIRGHHLVTLLGTSGSGKTTFLAALNVALTLNPEWILKGANEASTRALTDMTKTLVGGNFPPPTLGMDKIDLALSGELQAEGGLIRRRPVRLQVGLGLEVIDSSGMLLGQDSMDRAGTLDLMGCLKASTGIILFFDPLSPDDAYSRFHPIAAQLEARVDSVGQLPHRVAVCATKLDHPSIHSLALQGGYLVTDDADPNGFPRVPEDRAKAFFGELCAPWPQARLFQHAIRRYFRSDRTRYFTLSSIGYYMCPSLRFDASDYANTVPGQFGAVRLRGAPNPVSVIEPLAWLVAPKGQTAAPRVPSASSFLLGRRRRGEARSASAASLTRSPRPWLKLLVCGS